MNAHNHNHSISKTSHERPLFYAFLLTGSFLIAEIIGGIMTGSLALLSDAMHMLTDVAALAIALVAIHIAKRPADAKRTFGYYRFEILAATFNAVLLFLVALYILYEAYLRLRVPADVQSVGMLVIASLGLLVNVISMRLLATGKDNSLNMKGAYLEVWSDMLGSCGVIAGAIIIQLTQWTWVDSIIAIAIGLWVLPRTWILLKESINVLLEGVPSQINVEQLKQSLCNIKGIVDIHELHIWSLTSDKISLTAHIVIDETHNADTILMMLRNCLTSQFGISHTTLEIERKKCINKKELCNFTQ